MLEMNRTRWISGKYFKIDGMGSLELILGAFSYNFEKQEQNGR